MAVQNGDMDVEMEDTSEPLMQPVEVSNDHMNVADIREMNDFEDERLAPRESDSGNRSEAETSPSETPPLSGEYTWVIENFTSRRDFKINSEIFEAGGFFWNLLIFPRGNTNQRNVNSISCYLNNPDSDGPAGWQRRTHFKLTVLNKKPSKNFSREASHVFEGRENDWGFTSFMDLPVLLGPEKGFLQDDALHLKVEIKVEHPDNYLYNSKKKTAFVGLKNQGATCYLNSLLQTLYNINYFRKAVYHMPTTEDEVPHKSIPLALQSLFYKLQFDEHSVSTKSLTQSFGWTNMDAFTQHDVQELNRILSDKLEEKMKGTKVEGTIGKLFEGRMHNFVECVNVDFKSTRQEVYADLQLLVKGCKDMYESFDKYVEVEDLNGQNQYQAEGHGMQDAKKGMRFDSFPPVLQIQLRRFEYDFARDIMVKINDKYEFPEELDLDREDGKYLSENADRSVENKYRLHSVLVHSGGIHGGHYYAYCNPTGKQWLKFDDEKVTKEVSKQAMHEQFGGQDEPAPGFSNTYRSAAKFSNAYMLVYIRESDWNDIMCEVTKDDLAAHVRERLEAEQLEKERQRIEKEQSHLYTVIRVARDEDMKAQVGKDNFFFDLVDHEKVTTFRVKKYSKFAEFRKLIEQQWGVPADEQFWWPWQKRLNDTYRPAKERWGRKQDDFFVCKLESELPPNDRQWPPRLNLFLQTAPNATVRSLLMNTDSAKEVNLIFLKMYHPRENKLEYLGHFCALKHELPKNFLPLMKQMAGLAQEADVLVSEEVRCMPDLMIHPVNLDADFRANSMQNGDIFIIQEALPKEAVAKLKFPLVQDFLKYVRDRLLVTFRPLESPKDAGVELELNSLMSYKEVGAHLAEALKMSDPRFLRFTAHNVYSQCPKPQPIAYGTMDSLQMMLQSYGNTTADTVYYEILDLPLEEFEKVKSVKVNWHNYKGEQVAEHKVRVKTSATAGEVLEKLREVEPEAKRAKALRLMEVLHSKIYKILDEDSDEAVNDAYWTYRAEAIPEDELDLQEGEQILFLCHVSMKEDKRVAMFGDTICMKVGAKETVGELIQRIQQRLAVPDEEFAKWRFCHVKGISASAAESLNTDDIVTEKFPRQSNVFGGAGEQSFLGLVHSVTHVKRTPARTYNLAERSIRIN